MKQSATARIGLLPTGHATYWPQFKGLKERVVASGKKMEAILSQWGKVISPGLVDTEEKSISAGEFFDVWCQEGPGHHMALGIGDLSQQLETFAEAMQFEIARI